MRTDVTGDPIEAFCGADSGTEDQEMIRFWLTLPPSFHRALVARFQGLTSQLFWLTG
jgi:hypothetical protein